MHPKKSKTRQLLARIFSTYFYAQIKHGLRPITALSALFYAFVRRFTLALPPATLLTVIGSYVSILIAKDTNSASLSPSTFHTALQVIMFVGAPLILIQTLGAYLTAKYNVTLALNYWHLFDDLKSQRYIAVKEVRVVFHRPTNVMDAERFSKIEPVLDVFEDLGFLVSGQQISDVVAHHYFFHWLQLYTEPLEAILLTMQDNKETAYRHILPLYDRLKIVERWHMGFWRFIANKPISRPFPRNLDDEEHDNKPDEA
jgi:hypothetical protein